MEHRNDEMVAVRFWWIETGSTLKNWTDSGTQNSLSPYNYGCMKPESPRAIVLMGVSGCGKTSVGKALSASLGWPFFDGDDYHPQANIDKMIRGTPLDDSDRQPWLEFLNRLMRDHLQDRGPLVVASSALKQTYRDLLQSGIEGVVFVYLKGSLELIYARMQQREGHYMKAEMLRSQFKALEAPQDALTINIAKSVPEIAAEIIQKLNLSTEKNE
jgi:gluconokinase